MIRGVRLTMKMKRSDYFSKSSTVFSTLFFVFCPLFIMETIYSIRVVNQGLDTMVVPANLKSAPEFFRLSLRVESQGFPVEEMTKTKSWDELQTKVSGYADRLELLNKQNAQRSRRISWFYLFSAVGMVILSTLELRHIRKEA